MLFNSLDFLIFFPTVVALHFLLPHRWRWLMLLVASCWFYMAFVPAYIVILFLTIVIDYFAGLWIEKAEGKRRKWLLVVSLISNVGILAFFKYLGFFAENAAALFQWLNLPYAAAVVTAGANRVFVTVLGLFGQSGVSSYTEAMSILPIGLSFHTFQAMSYTIEVYRGNQRAERHFGIYALYVMFFPQLVAGPIERPQNVLHQFHEKKTFDAARALDGLRWIYWGLFKKMVVADRLSQFVDPVFNGPNPEKYGALATAAATVAFAIQIYCDFSGYSDVAIGTAKVMGYKLMEIFRRPYLATNIQAFWARWHISLSTWFRDYVYIPLGGNRVSRVRRYLNVAVVFLVSGFWHGAAWTYLVWGALHTVFNLGTMALREAGWLKLPERRWANVLGIAFTFLLVSFAWIFFRAHTIADALTLIRTLGTWRGWDVEWQSLDYWALRTGDPKPPFRIIFSGVALALLGLGDWLIEKKKDRLTLPQLQVLRPALYAAMVVFFLLFAVFDSGKQFIYFQF